MTRDRNRARLAVVSLLVCLAAAPFANAQGNLPRGVAGGGMATRSVAKYLDLERALQEGLARRDRNSVVGLLADDFEVRTAATPDAIAGDEWLRREFASSARDRIVRDLSVREFDDLAIVSFLLDRAKGPRAAGAGATLFVVDVWRQSSARLLTRYVEHPANPPPVPSRPTGRE